MSESKKRNVNAVEDTGRQVAANIKRLRGGMTYRELSDRLEEVGRPIAVLGLKRIESGERKVDVDDLMAFAIVFGVSPLTLLMPEYGSRAIATNVTGDPHKIGANIAWLWALGSEPLEVPNDAMLHYGSPDTARAIAEYRSRAVPAVESRNTDPASYLPTELMDKYRDAMASARFDEVREKAENEIARIIREGNAEQGIASKE